MSSADEVPAAAATAAENGDGGQRHRPNKAVPTERLVLTKQVDILRAYAIKSGPEHKAVLVTEAADVLKMASTTVSMVNPFFVENGLLSRSKDGFVPSQEVYNYARAYEFNPATAARKLAGAFKRSWFAEALLPKLRFRPMPLDEAISELADVASASHHYKQNLELAIRYLELVGILRVDDSNMVYAESEQDHHAANPQEQQRQETPKPEDPKVKPPPPPAPVSPQPAFNPMGGVAFNVSFNIDMAELSTWTADRIAALFSGVAQVVAAKKGLQD